MTLYYCAWFALGLLEPTILFMAAAAAFALTDEPLRVVAPKIRTSFDYPPIPVRGIDWSAVTHDYEPGDPIGRGRTEQAAINDLLELLND